VDDNNEEKHGLNSSILENMITDNSTGKLKYDDNADRDPLNTDNVFNSNIIHKIFDVDERY
jgi:hypothetical protein